MKTALVAGASGLIGGELVKLLAVSDTFQKIHVLTRRPLMFQHPKVVEHVVDFNNLTDFTLNQKVDVAFCALGTTMKKAGSRAAFEQVDFTYILEFARMAKRLGADHFLVVSAMGANEKSLVYYNRIKGRTEVELRRVGFEQLSVFRPSLLLGKRNESRFGERLAEKVMLVIDFLVPSNYKPIEATQVASFMLRIADGQFAGEHIFHSAEMRK